MRVRCSLCHCFIAIERFGVNVESTAGKFIGVWALTIRSSRSRFAARLNSGVRPAISFLAARKLKLRKYIEIGSAERI